jgi:23S rRNA (cytidine1920-2'-O)/16S rRNA (cytidine1409-2'-O)-methyltransferase
VVALVKPQFEVGRDLAAKGKGVIRDEKVREQVVEDIVAFAKQEGYEFLGEVESP